MLSSMENSTMPSSAPSRKFRIVTLTSHLQMPAEVQQLCYGNIYTLTMKRSLARTDNFS